MPENTPKKRITRRILLVLLIILLAVIIIPIATLYVQYRKHSYVPMQPVERSDEYVLPDYPDIIIGSEGITDMTDAPAETIEPVTEPPQTEPTATTDVLATTDVPATAEPVEGTEEVPVTTVPVTDPPETLPSVTYAPTVTDEPDSGEQSDAPVYTPVYNENNSFSKNPNSLSVYGSTPIYKVAQKDPNVMNILILGTDSRDVVIDRGRSDMMIVVSYNQKTGTIKMVSLLRDLLVPVEGYDWNRINTAYFFDGVGLSINTVNQLFGLDIQHFVVVDFNGVKDFINHLGGIELTLTEAEAAFINVEYTPGPILLNGDKILWHSRNRSVDNDFGRTERQREVIVAVCNKIIAEKSITEIFDITQYAMRMIKTNIPATTLTSLAVSVLGGGKSISIEQQSIPYDNAYQFAWYRGMAIISFDIQSAGARMREFLYK